MSALIIKIVYLCLVSSFIVIFLSAEYTLAATKIVRIVFYTAATLGENSPYGVAE